MVSPVHRGGAIPATHALIPKGQLSSLRAVNWISISWLVAIAACVTLAVVHALIALRLRGRARAAHLFFTLSAAAVAATGGIELALMNTDSLASYQTLMLWAEMPLWLMIVSLAGFTWNFFGTGRKGHAVAVAGLITAVLVANFLAPQDLRIRHAVELHTVESFGGVTFTLARMKNGLLTIGEIAASVLLMVFVARASVALWQRGQRRRAAMVGGSIVFFLLATRAYALLVESGQVQTPFFFIFPFLGLLMAMGYELSQDVYAAAHLAEQLHESERQMELAARAATMGFWLWDLKRDEIWATGSARALFGLSNKERIDFGRFMATLDPDDREAVQRAADHALATGEDYEMEYRVKVDDGKEHWIVARGRVENGEDGKPLLMRGIVQDITDRKKAERRVVELRRELAHVARVSTLGELAGSLAHELNQPLAAILSNAQAARRFLAAPDVDLNEICAILDDIVRDDKRAGEVIHRLRGLVQNRVTPEAEPIHLNDLVRDTQRLLNSELLSRNIELELELRPSLPPALAGRVEIQQVLLNLTVNAMDALRDQSVEQRRITIRTDEGEGMVRVAVQDTGPGISDSAMPDIFRPFFTTKQHGLGMGLAICRSMLEAYGGKLWAENHLAGGALFQFELPSAPGAVRP